MLRPPTSVLLAQTSLLSSEFIFPTADKRTSSLGYSTAILNSTYQRWTYILQTCIFPYVPLLGEWPHSVPTAASPKVAHVPPHSQLVTKSYLLFHLSISCSVHRLLSRLPTIGSWIALSCFQYQTLNPLFLRDSNHSDHLFKTHQQVSICLMEKSPNSVTMQSLP